MAAIQVNMRVPEVLLARINAVAGDERTKWILEACRMRLDGDAGAAESVCASKRVAEGHSFGGCPSGRTGWFESITPATKPDIAVLRAICAGQPVEADEGAWTNLELPPCSECAGDLRNVKGKWACADVSCGKFGVEQKPRW
jgi:hypothetical protein